MPRYVINGVEVPVNPVNAEQAITPAPVAAAAAIISQGQKEKDALKALPGRGVVVDAGGGGPSIVSYAVTAAVVGGLGWWLLKKKRGAGSAPAA